MLNKQGTGTMIDWADYSLNIIAGKCRNNCDYCYMRRFWRLGDNATLQLKEHYLKCKLPEKPSKIFLGSSTDMWGDWVSPVWIKKVLGFVEQNPKHTFLFLTKNPEAYSDWDLQGLSNCWFGTTVDGTDRTKYNIGHLVSATSSYCRINRFVSFDPLLAPVDPDLFGIKLIIIGANSNRGAKKPPKEWATHLISKARGGNISVWVKNNYRYPEIINEFPA